MKAEIRHMRDLIDESPDDRAHPAWQVEANEVIDALEKLTIVAGPCLCCREMQPCQDGCRCKCAVDGAA